MSKIVGPGNRWVSAAKAVVAQDCPIDFYAGPTEILIVAERGRASWIAADLIAQAEHDPDARAVFITANRALATGVAEEVARQLPAEGPAATSLWHHGGIVVTRTMVEAEALANDAATEHLVDTEAGLAIVTPARCSSGRGRRSPATSPSAPTTRCRRPASPVCVAVCTPPTS
jgi:histidinol dehydrogenase